LKFKDDFLSSFFIPFLCCQESFLLAIFCLENYFDVLYGGERCEQIFLKLKTSIK